MSWRAVASPQDPKATDVSNCWAVFGRISYKYCETDVIASSGRLGSHLLWVDNRRVIFVGYAGPKPQTPEQLRSLRYSLYVWSPGRPARIYTDMWNGGYYCVDHGIVRYDIGTTTLPDGQKVRLTKSGPPGAEVVEVPRAEPVSPAGTLSQGESFNCENTLKPERNVRYWSALRRGHGYVARLGLRDRKGPLMLYTPDQPDGIALQIPSNEALVRCRQYFPFIGAYLFWTCNPPADPDRLKQWRESNCMPYWLVWPDGRTRRSCVPFGDWGGADMYLAMTRKGLVFAGKKLGGRGVYLMTIGRVHLLTKGIVWGLRTSPDGCRVAFSYAKDDNDARLFHPGRGYRGRVIDFCFNKEN